MNSMPYVPQSFTRTLGSTSQFTARQRIEASLRLEGFFVLEEVDVRALIQSRLHLEYQPYVILGAVKPELVHEFILNHPTGTFMVPDSISITADAAGEAVLSILGPAALMGEYHDPERFQAPLVESRTRLQRALANA